MGRRTGSRLLPAGGRLAQAGEAGFDGAGMLLLVLTLAAYALAMMAGSGIRSQVSGDHDTPLARQQPVAAGRSPLSVLPGGAPSG